MALCISAFHFTGFIELQNIVSSKKNLACFSLLLALDNPKVNYFSLDIEGAEIQVLRSVPWHLVNIEVRLVLSFL